MPFLEAIRQLRHELGHQNSVAVHLTLVPYIAAGRRNLKTKPTQHSVQKLREIGIILEILICRVDRPLEPGMAKKIASFCNVHADAVFTSQDVPSIYEVPIRLNGEGLDDKLAEPLEHLVARAAARRTGSGSSRRSSHRAAPSPSGSLANMCSSWSRTSR